MPTPNSEAETLYADRRFTRLAVAAAGAGVTAPGEFGSTPIGTSPSNPVSARDTAGPGSTLRGGAGTIWSRTALARGAAAALTVAVGISLSAVAAPSPALAEGNWLDELVGDCPSLYVLAVQGTGESAADAPVKADTGMLGTVVSAFLAKAQETGASVDRAYVPYAAGFGGAVPGGKESYLVSVTGAQDNLDAAASKVLEACPTTKLAILGYSQGGHAASNFLKEVGAGRGVVPAAAIATGALFGAPTRAAGSGVFPGTSQTQPSAVPGTSGTAVKALPAVSVTPATGSGIGPIADTATSFGALNGRISMWCEPGDLACDAPASAPIARAVTNVAGQAEIGGDPFVAVQTIGLALASTAFNVAVKVINEDIQAPKNSLENLSIAPKKPLSQRLAEASDPRATPPTGQEALAALMKVGMIAFNSVVTVAKKVITPETIAAVASVGLANPLAAFGVLAAKTVDAVIGLVPPATQQRVVKQTFDLVTKEVTANRDLFDLAALAKYANVQAAHKSYGSSASSTSGLSPTQYVAAMFAAVASDLAGGTSAGSSDSSTDSSSGAPKPSTSTTSPTSTTTTSVASSASSTPSPTTTEPDVSQGGVSPTDSSTEGTTSDE